MRGSFFLLGLMLSTAWLIGEAAAQQKTTTPPSVSFIGVPLVQNFGKIDYQAGNQNWAITYASDGQLYVANSEGLLAFDGQHWKLSPMPSRVLVRSVAAGSHGTVYSGGFGEFGVWTKDSFGRMVYRSLSDKLDKQDRPHDEIWKIHVDSSEVFFQSFSSIYRYRNGKVEAIVKTKHPFLFSYRVRGRYFVEILTEGLFELVQGRLVKRVNSVDYGNSIILSLLPFGEKDVLIGTSKKGLFLWRDQNGGISPWKTEANEAFMQYELNNGLEIGGNHYVFGTILNGIYILNKQGKLVQHINKSTGLQNNTVLSLQQDQQQNLWVGLDNGLDRIEIHSPIYYYDDRSGGLGTVYTAKIYRDKIYLGTNQGLFYSLWPVGTNHFQFHLVEGSQGQVWDLYEQDGELLCGHNNGTFRVRDAQIQWLSTVTGGYVLRPLAADSGRLIQGTYTGLALFKKGSKGWAFERKIDSFNEPVQYFQQRSPDRFWLSGYKGLYSIQLRGDQTAVMQQKRYTAQEGLPESSYVHVFDLGGRIVFATDSGFYQHDEITDRFHAYTQLNERLGTFANANKIIPSEGNRYWFIRKGHLALVNFGPDGRVNIDSTQFSVLSNRMLSYYENVNSLSPALSLISLDNGFALYRKREKFVSLPLPAPLIQKVEDIRDSTVRLLDFDRTEAVVWGPKQNNLRISFSLPYFSLNRTLFQYQLEGISDSWSAWTEITQKEFTNLASGTYRFRVRARVNGQSSPIATLVFQIAAPWYRSVWAYVLYGGIAIGIGYGFRRYNQRKLERHREAVHQQVLKEQEERLQKEMVENEQKLIRLKNHQLENELASKNRELANSAMNIVYKNELLNNVHEELLQLRDAEGRKLSGDQLKKISKIIEDARSDERDWNLFEESFNETHENFFKKLKIHYPELVPNDLKLCAYLRMNMSSKEIASLLNITTRGVEIRRYRLRKKLNLPHDQNLTEFLIGL